MESMRTSHFFLCLLSGVAASAETSAGSTRGLCADGRIVVVGAGISGLGAAHALTLNGCEVLVLEARSRIGGRTHTATDGPLAGLDLGAHWIEGNSLINPVKQLILNFSLPFTTLSSNADEPMVETFALYNSSGHRMSKKELAVVSSLWEDHLRRLAALAQSRRDAHQVDLSMADAFALVRKQITPPLTKQQLRVLDWCVSKVVISDDAGFLSADSLFSFVFDDSNDFAVYNGTLGGGDDVLLHGYSSLANALAARLDVRLNAPVANVEYRRKGPAAGAVRVELVNGTTVEAAAVVVTVPLGVLKASVIKFNPPLPSAVEHAIQVIGMGIEDHVYLHYTHPPWPREVYNFGYVSEKRGELSDIYNLETEHLGTTLNMFNSGSFAAGWSKLTDAAVQQRSEQVVSSMFSNGQGGAQAFMRSNWLVDPYARGSYSFPGVNTTLRDWQSFSQAFPAGERLLFAGEHTCALANGLVHGAYVSGVRAAQQVLGGKGAGKNTWPLVPSVVDLCDVLLPQPAVSWGIENTFPGPGSGSRRTWRAMARAFLSRDGAAQMQVIV